MAEQYILRSLESRHKVYLSIRNTLNDPIDAFWVDFSGDFKLYYTIQPHKSVDINTYISHPWLFRNRMTGQALLCDGKRILRPIPLLVRTANGQIQYRRKPLSIHIELHSLQMCALLKIFRILRTDADIKKLEIPNHLKVELETIFAKAQSYHRANVRNTTNDENHHHNINDDDDNDNDSNVDDEHDGHSDDENDEDHEGDNEDEWEDDDDDDNDEWEDDDDDDDDNDDGDDGSDVESDGSDWEDVPMQNEAEDAVLQVDNDNNQ